MEKLKLFVVGASSGDPEQWSPWFDRAIVLAHDKTEAIAISGMDAHEATEISIIEPVLLGTYKSAAEEWSDC